MGVAHDDRRTPTARCTLRPSYDGFRRANDEIQGKKYCLVIVNMFSKWVEAFPTSKADA